MQNPSGRRSSGQKPDGGARGRLSGLPAVRPCLDCLLVPHSPHKWRPSARAPLLRPLAVRGGCVCIIYSHINLLCACAGSGSPVKSPPAKSAKGGNADKEVRFIAVACLRLHNG